MNTRRRRSDTVTSSATRPGCSCITASPTWKELPTRITSDIPFQPRTVCRRTSPGKPVSGPIPNLDAPAFDALWHKAHVSYVNGPLEIWGRFVQDGEEAPPSRSIYSSTRPAGTSLDDWTTGREILNHQYTLAVRFKKELSPAWNLELLQSDDYWDVQGSAAPHLVRAREPTRVADENQAFSRAIAVWTPNDAHSLAFGAEYSHMWFHDPPYSDALDIAPVVAKRDWQTDTISFLAEHQWRISGAMDDVPEFPHGQEYLFGLVAVAARHGGVHADEVGHFQADGRPIGAPR